MIEKARTKKLNQDTKEENRKFTSFFLCCFWAYKGEKC